MKTIGYAAHSADTPLVAYHFERRNLRPNDVAIEILYSGVCHSDLHTVNGDWGEQPYPLVPGHEIVGRVLEVGPDVTKYKVDLHFFLLVCQDSRCFLDSGTK